MATTDNLKDFRDREVIKELLIRANASPAFLEKALSALVEGGIRPEVISALAEAKFEGKTIEGKENVRSWLEIISEGSFFPIDRINRTLIDLSKGEIRIPDSEVARLNELFPNQLTHETLKKVLALKGATQREQGPLIMQIPRLAIVKGQEVPFNLDTIEKKFQGLNAGVGVQDRASTHSIAEKLWPSELTVWTSDVLNGSVGKLDSELVRYQGETVGSGCGVDADIAIAALFNLILAKRKIMTRDYMRLNSRGSDGRPLVFLSIGSPIFIIGSLEKEPSLTNGIGACVRISPEGTIIPHITP